MESNICPAPLIASPISNYTDKTCIGGCCLPCPYINNFYPPAQIDTIYTPSKREHPAMIVLLLNAFLLLFLSVTFFYIGNHKYIQCADDFTQSTMENNLLCGIQAVTKNISFDFGAVCLVSGKISLIIFWTPLAVFVIPAFLIHLMTFVHISRAQWMLARDFENSSLGTVITRSSISVGPITGQDVLNVIKIQWRSLLLTMILIFTFIIFMIYSILATHQLSPFLSDSANASPWIFEWISCLVKYHSTNNGQSQLYFHGLDSDTHDSGTGKGDQGTGD
ncbi:5736_t:CDS:2 [Dentiscutata heterogama]|uniref:5736_t:CDS:1 n=1 Tax=Dentiscutata heterogama TaxID=1316150 RepID=A0ACA9LFN5_9GLOM|nr:5736_t:CDS:2 [Dentiscutata heterogama]